VRNTEAFVPIVDRSVFDRVQRIIKKRGAHPNRSDAYFVQGMKRVLAHEGKLTKRILERKFTFSHAYYKRFGSVIKAYELAGFVPPSQTVKLIHTQERIRSLRNGLYVQLKRMFSDGIRFISLPGQQFRQIMEIDGRIRVSVYLCRAVTHTSAGELGWLLRVRPLEKDFPALLCTVDESATRLLNFYVFSSLADIRKYRLFRENQPWLSGGWKLGKLDDLCDVAKEVASRFENVDCYVEVDDIRIGIDNSIITLGKREITLGPVGSAIFNMLALNAGQVISREQLRSVFKGLLDPTNLTSHINRLRVKLGRDDRERIRTVTGVGYMYASPAKIVDCRTRGQFGFGDTVG
jgi:DNA-binding winged helix-turn-helix (wHTH) protein